MNEGAGGADVPQALFYINELHIAPEKLSQSERIPGIVLLDQLLGYAKNPIVHS